MPPVLPAQTMPFSLAQSTEPLFTSATTRRKASYEPFRVPSAQRTPDCHPPSSVSSRSRKLKTACTYGWQ